MAMSTKRNLVLFDVTKWKAGAKPVTRDGREVLGLRDLREFFYNSDFPLQGVVQGHSCEWRNKGQYSLRTSSGVDLMLEAPEPMSPHRQEDEAK